MHFSRSSRLSLWQRFANLPAVGMLIIVTAIISSLAFLAWAVNSASIQYFALQPTAILQGKYLWTLFIHMFVHGGLLHLFVNMFVLFSLGGLCEKIIGRRRFFWFYMSAGIFAGILAVLTAGLFGFGFWAKVFGTSEDYMVGASGAIFALAGLLMVLLPRLRFSIIFLPFFSLPAYIMVPFVLVATWALSVAAGWHVGNIAHFGGFVVGLLYGYYLRLTYRRKILLLERYFR